MKVIVDIPKEAYDFWNKCVQNGTASLSETLIARGSVFEDRQVRDDIVYAPKLFNGCVYCDAHEHCPDAFCSHAVHCGAYGKENNVE